MIHLYRINTGSCSGCDSEIEQAIRGDSGLDWASSPYAADALLLTGPITIGCRPAFLALLAAVGPLPLLAIGRCAIDGHPFGRGGVQELPNVVVRLKLDGCPPLPEAIAEAIHTALTAAPAASPPVAPGVAGTSA